MTPGLVRVILSTWNSEAFIRPLLDSVLGQTYEPLELWVRDDGSKDATPAILAEYAARHPGKLRVAACPNVGMVQSYFTLIRDAGNEAEFTAFCDHDDVWHPDKIARAVQALREMPSDVPALYTGRLHIVDDAGAHLGYSLLPARPLAFANALVENVAAACTMVMNAPARDLLLRQRSLDGIFWPDWWFYLVVSAFGQVTYDTEARVEYRRHGGNAVGSPTGLRRVREGLRTVRQGTLARRLVVQARALEREFGDTMPPESRGRLARFIQSSGTLAGRLSRALAGDTYRQRAIDGVVIRLLLATAGDA